MREGYLFGALLGLAFMVTACGSESVPTSGESEGHYTPDYETDGGDSDPVVFGTFCGNDFVTEEFEIENGQYTEFASGVSVQYFIDNSLSYKPEIVEDEDGKKYVDYGFGGDATWVHFMFRNGSVPSSYGEWCGRPCVDDGLGNYYIKTYIIDGVENCVDDIHWGKCTKDSSPEDFEAEFGASLLTDWNHEDNEQTLVYASQTHFIEFHFIDGVLHRVKCDTLWFYGFLT
jgi:hypothetical protein